MDSKLHREIHPPAPYPPIDAAVHADSGTATLTYHVVGADLAATVTVTPETGDGTTAIPQGIHLTWTCGGRTATIPVDDVPPRGQAPCITCDQVDPAAEDERAGHLAAVLSALVADWANRRDTHRMRRIAATRTASSRLTDAGRILTDLRAQLRLLVGCLEEQYSVTEELRGLVAERQPILHPPSDDSRLPPLDPTPIERGLRAAYAVAAHALHTDPDATTAEIYNASYGYDAIAAFLTDLLHLLSDLDIEPSELTQQACDAYDTQSAEFQDADTGL